MTTLNLGPTLNFLNSAYLEAWNQDPSSGSLVMPLWDSGPGGPGFLEGAVMDTRTARNAVEAAASVLEDCQNFRAALKEEGRQLPHPLPQRAAGWMLTTLQDANSEQGGKARFDQAEQTKTVTLDLLNPGTASFEVTLKKGSAELTQKVDVDRRHFHVSTEYYFIKTKKDNAHRAVELAVLIANLVYQSGQYNVAYDLGVPPRSSGTERPSRRKSPSSSMTTDSMASRAKTPTPASRAIFPTSTRFNWSRPSPSLTPTTASRS